MFDNNFEEMINKGLFKDEMSYEQLELYVYQSSIKELF